MLVTINLADILVRARTLGPMIKIHLWKYFHSGLPPLSKVSGGKGGHVHLSYPPKQMMPQSTHSQYSTYSSYSSYSSCSAFPGPLSFKAKCEFLCQQLVWGSLCCQQLESNKKWPHCPQFRFRMKFNLNFNLATCQQLASVESDKKWPHCPQFRTCNPPSCAQSCTIHRVQDFS